MTVRMCEFKSAVLPDDAVAGYDGTWVWGYLYDPTGDSTCAELIAQYSQGSGVLDTYTGPVIVNERGSSTDINFVNDLGSAPQPMCWLTSIRPTRPCTGPTRWQILQWPMTA